jgi:hypothetical protein
MQHSTPHLTRKRVAALITAALALAPVLVLALFTGERTAGALPAQRFTTRQRLTTESTAPETTEPDEDPPPTKVRPRPTQTTEPAPPRPATTAAKVATTRKPAVASTMAPAPTSVVTMPPSTEAPELLVAGPVAAEGTAVEGSQDSGVSTSTALRWVIIGLVVVGLVIGGLTIAYWRHTRPRRAEPWESDGDDGLGAPPDGGHLAGFPPVTADVNEPYRPPGQSRPPDPFRQPGQSGPQSPGSRPGGSSLWDRPPPVRAGDGYDQPWGSS